MKDNPTDFQTLQGHFHSLEEELDETYRSVLELTNELGSARESLAGSQAKIAQIINGSPIATFVLDATHTITHWNKAMERITDCSKEEMVGTHRQGEPFSVDKRPTLADLLLDHSLSAEVERQHPGRFGRSTLLNGGYEWEEYLEIKGAGRWLYFLAAPLRDPQGEVNGAVETIQDITDRIKGQLALKESERRYRIVSNNTYNWEIWRDTDGRWLYCSPACKRITGYGADAFEGDPKLILKIVHPEDVGKILDHQTNEADRRKPGKVVFRIIHRDGSIRWIEHNCQPLFSDGEYLGCRACNQDITKRKHAEEARARLENQLRQAQKMESLGTLAGGIAHDFNNVLSAIIGFTELARDDLEDRPAAANKLDRVLTAADRAGEMVKQILTFSRKTDVDLRPLDLNQLVESSIDMLRRTIPRMIEIDLLLDPAIGAVNGNATQLEQVLMNLGINAADAMPQGGRLVMKTETIKLADELIVTMLKLHPGLYVLLSVADDGEGIDPDNLAHIFDPFFTTKEVGEGTGLGLSTVFGIVKSHGGHITCYSEPGQGTTFKVYLPVLEDEGVFRSESAKLDEGAYEGTETILLVDDEQVLRDIGKELLSDFGYTVLMAGSGEDALKVLQESEGNIDLVVLDLNMPGMGGKKCLEVIKDQFPHTKVIIATGHSSPAMVQKSLSLGAEGFVGKPFRRQKLLECLRSALDS